MQDNELLYLSGIAISLAVIFLLLMVRIWTAGEKAYSRIIARRNRMARLSALPEVMRKMHDAGKKPGWFYIWNRELDKQMKKAGWNIRPMFILVSSFVFALMGAAAGFKLLSDPVLSVIISVMLANIPFLILNWAIQKSEQRIVDQLSSAIHLFAVEFEMVKNIRESLARTAAGVEQPLRGHIERCVKELDAGKPPREAFKNFGRALNCEYGRLWARMLLAATEDVTVLKLMPRQRSEASRDNTEHPYHSRFYCYSSVFP